MRNGNAGGGGAAPESAQDCGDPDCDACHFARIGGVRFDPKYCINAGRRVDVAKLWRPSDRSAS